MRIIFRVVVLTTTLNLLACEVDSYIENSCGDLPDLNEFGAIVERDSVMYYAPCFNPADGNEFVYIEWRSKEMINKLYAFNIQTGEKVFLADNVLYNPQWNSKDWIIFNRYDSEIWKVKSNGDSLSELFSNGTNYEIVISPDGRKFAFKNQIESEIKILISDINGVLLDSLLNTSFNDASWSRDNSKVAANKSGLSYILGYYDTSFTIYHQVFDNEGNTGEAWDHISDTEWFPDSKRILWLASGKYWTTNIETHRTEVFYEPCESNYNSFPNFSPDGNSIIWEKTKSAVLDGGNLLYLQNSIVLTDINGFNEITVLPND